MSTIVLPSSLSTIPSFSITTDDGFYTDTAPSPIEHPLYLARDRNNLIAGCVLGVILFLSFLVAFILTLKLYHRKKKQEQHDSQDQIEKTSFLSLDPGSQFSLAVKRASEIPDSPTV